MPERKTARSSVITSLGVIFFSLLISVVCLEIILHFVPNPLTEKYGASKGSSEIKVEPHPKDMYSMVNDFHWRLTPYSNENWVTGYYNIDVKANSQGIRDIEYSDGEANTYRVLGLGDSFAFGWGVSEEDSFYKQLQSRLNSYDFVKNEGIQKFEVINAGIPGFGTYEALEMLKDLGARYSPDLILLAFYEGNDYLNNKDAPRSRQIFQGFLKNTNDDNDSKLDKKFKKISILYSAIYDVIDKLREKRRFRSSVLSTKGLLTEMKKYSAEINALLHVFIIPDQDPAFYSRSSLLQKYDDIVAGMNLYDAREELLRFGETEGLNINVLSSKFEDNAGEISLDKSDAHFNEKGHGLAAEEMFLSLEQQLVN